MRCDRLESSAIERYFYDELDAAERARVEAHLAECTECRQTLIDLRHIRRALADRPRIDAPPAGDWSGFMRRLDQACRTDSAPVEAMSADRFRLNTASRAWSGSSRRSWVRKAVVTAASLALIGSAGFIEERLRLASPAPRVTSGPAAASGQAAPEADRSAARAVAELSEQHFERSKLVVLGLVARDPDHTERQGLGVRARPGRLAARGYASLSPRRTRRGSLEHRARHVGLGDRAAGDVDERPCRPGGARSRAAVDPQA